MFQHNKILILAPHTDDGELGCGGFIHRAIKNNNTVYYVAFSTADESLPDIFPKNQLEIEVKAATKILGIDPKNLIIFKHQVRKLNYVRQEILDALIKLRDYTMPDIVLLPSRQDIHQDHQTITSEGIRAFKNCTILGYELIWNNLQFSPHFFCTLSDDDLDAKLAALKKYTSQNGKAYMDADFIRSIAKVRGTQISAKYAEAFEVIRWIF